MMEKRDILSLTKLFLAPALLILPERIRGRRWLKETEAPNIIDAL